MTDVDGVMEAAEAYRAGHSSRANLAIAVERAAKLAVYDGIVAVLKEAASATCGEIRSQDEHNGKPACFDDHDKNWNQVSCYAHQKLAEYEALAAEVRG